jgi:hypothetical protein
LVVEILRITALAGANGTDGDESMVFVDSIDYAMGCELVFPVTREWPAQRQSVAFQVNRQLLL